ncbi:nuclear transport factor 2 family protein [Nisaea acidiphila]|uniref:Nuclear transport factor 2 family protein n=1 Tax=Nisaea acidiphila TaxID=1862145 RepID=A0A9J7B3S6_9PROT|nr:nuclear transport factor 2 family protein [Nisaea acidiphila]UUX52277.1 nuclear transport factor 2 family protein [Nisaea acidiphila]
MSAGEWLKAYAHCYETLTEESLDSVAALLAEDVRFSDPFSDVTGRDQVVAIFRHMYEAMENPAFEILGSAVGEPACYLKWRMTGRVKSAGRREIEIVGVSEVEFDGAGLVTRHIDHWDAASQVFGLFPVLGSLLRWLGRGFAPGK